MKKIMIALALLVGMTACQTNRTSVGTVTTMSAVSSPGPDEWIVGPPYAIPWMEANALNKTMEETFPGKTYPYLRPDDTILEATVKILQIWQYVSPRAVVTTTRGWVNTLYSTLKTEFPNYPVIPGIKMFSYVISSNHNWLGDPVVWEALADDCKRATDITGTNECYIMAESPMARYFNKNNDHMGINAEILRSFYDAVQVLKNYDITFVFYPMQTVPGKTSYPERQEVTSALLAVWQLAMDDHQQTVFALNARPVYVDHPDYQLREDVHTKLAPNRFENFFTTSDGIWPSNETSAWSPETLMEHLAENGAASDEVTVYSGFRLQMDTGVKWLQTVIWR